MNGLKAECDIRLGRGIPLVFLHGWGCDARSFGGAMEYFSRRGRTCMTFSFPPFGGTDMPPEDWSLRDYSAFTLALLDKCAFDKVIFIGHSFGGRVAIDIASGEDKERAYALALVAAAGVRPRRGLRYALRRMAFKRDKRLGRDVTKYYSPDWLALPERMRGVFSRIVSEDLTERLNDISCPTVLFWGDGDRETPPYMCGIMARRIRGAEAIRLKGGHFAYAEDHVTFVTSLAELIEKWTLRLT